MASVDGSEARRAAQLIGGGVSGWFPNGARLLVSGRESYDADPFLAALDVDDGSVIPIARGARLRGGAFSPEGGWVAYQITFSGDAAQDGPWVARTDGSQARRLDVYGAYRWRAEGRLLVIPLEMDAPAQRILEMDAATGQALPANLHWRPHLRPIVQLPGLVRAEDHAPIRDRDAQHPFPQPPAVGAVGQGVNPIL